jgi:hypothetical protein
MYAVRVGFSTVGGQHLVKKSVLEEIMTKKGSNGALLTLASPRLAS